MAAVRGNLENNYEKRLISIPCHIQRFGKGKRASGERGEEKILSPRQQQAKRIRGGSLEKKDPARKKTRERNLKS